MFQALAKFEMLLESLLDKDKFSRTVTTSIDDYLTDPKTNRVIEVCSNPVMILLGLVLRGC